MPVAGIVEIPVTVIMNVVCMAVMAVIVGIPV
jgi:hypothetical protein